MSHTKITHCIQNGEVREKWARKQINWKWIKLKAKTLPEARAFMRFADTQRYKPAWNSSYLRIHCWLEDCNAPESLFFILDSLRTMYFNEQSLK